MTVPRIQGRPRNHAFAGAKVPRLIVINQSVGPAFLDWLVQPGGYSGPVELWSGNAPDTWAQDHVRHLAPYDNSHATSRLVTWGRLPWGRPGSSCARADRHPYLS